MKPLAAQSTCHRCHVHCLNTRDFVLVKGVTFDASQRTITDHMSRICFVAMFGDWHVYFQRLRMHIGSRNQLGQRTHTGLPEFRHANQHVWAVSSTFVQNGFSATPGSACRQHL